MLFDSVGRNLVTETRDPSLIKGLDLMEKGGSTQSKSIYLVLQPQLSSTRLSVYSQHSTVDTSTSINYPYNL
jgi:hypothetical protein